jgi:hypothetical protein
LRRFAQYMFGKLDDQEPFALSPTCAGKKWNDSLGTGIVPKHEYQHWDKNYPKAKKV